MKEQLTDNNLKSLHVTEDNYHIWIQPIIHGTTAIFVTDSETSVNYYVADFNGFKYSIKHKIIFNNVFLKSAKQKPKIIRDLLKFHYTSCEQVDVIKDLKLRFKCFSRRISVYSRKKINKLKYG